jgi:pimeloyl-ACP methyl ester carboxylesterase
MNEAMDATMKKAGSDKLELVGYSGGAAIAVLIAARREDVLSLRTIAGNLDPDAVNRYHKVSPMAGSFNPMDFAVKIKDVPQRHFVGAEDKIIPISVAWSFVERQGDVARLRVTVVKNATHTGGWAGAWRKMLLEPCLS